MFISVLYFVKDLFFLQNDYMLNQVNSKSCQNKKIKKLFNLFALLHNKFIRGSSTRHNNPKMNYAMNLRSLLYDLPVQRSSNN